MFDTWAEALALSRRTSKKSNDEKDEDVKSISRIERLFDRKRDTLLEDVADRFSGKLQQEWNDVNALLSLCTDLRTELLETLTSCESKQPVRLDIIEFFMEHAHSAIIGAIDEFWHR